MCSCIRKPTLIKRNIKIISLNGSGANSNPHEYYASEDNEYLKLAGAFHVKRLEEEKIGEIYDMPGDQDLQGRYSAFYRLIYPVGDRASFEAKWNEVYEEQKAQFDKVFGVEIPKMAKRGKNWTYETLLDAFRRSDYEFAKSLALFADSDPKWFKAFEDQYKNFRCTLEYKIRAIIDYVRSSEPDVICLQEIAEEQLPALRKLSDMYNFTGWSKGTITLYHRSLPFGQLTAWPNIFNQTVYIGNERVVIANIHCTSKKPADNADNYKSQTEALFGGFIGDDRAIIAVGDFNHDITKDEYACYGAAIRMDQPITCNKKRTDFQMQKKKANKVDASLKDAAFIMSNNAGREVFKDSEKTPKVHVKMLDGLPFTKEKYLPNNQHPSDHGLIEFTIQVPISVRL